MSPAPPIVTPLTYSIALVFAPRSVSPGGKMEVSMDFPSNVREVLVQIFGDPVHTNVNFTPVGISAVVPANPPNAKIVEVTPLKIMAQTPLPNETAHALATVYREFFKAQKVVKFMAYGLNYELEFFLPGVSDTAKWLAERFIIGNLATPPQWNVARGEIAFSINHQEGFQRNIKLQPRMNRINGFFASVNNHITVPADVQADDENAWIQALQNEYLKTTAFLVELLGDLPPKK